MARSVENSGGESWAADRDLSPSHLLQYSSLQGNAMVTWCVCVSVCVRACVSGKCRAQACHEM